MNQQCGWVVVQSELGAREFTSTNLKTSHLVTCCRKDDAFNHLMCLCHLGILGSWIVDRIDHSMCRHQINVKMKHAIGHLAMEHLMLTPFF